jgi:Uma2 family endonuclease
MGQPAEKRYPATYADYAAVPENKVAELIHGTLYVFPRPAPKHARAATRLTSEIVGPFDLGKGGPGGWHILDEPELHLMREQPMIPDRASWRVERMPELPDEAYFALPPDWVCEVLSPSTEAYDRGTKMPIYADHEVRWAWLLDPIERRLEIFTLAERGRWGKPTIYQDAAQVRAVPFDAIELDLSVLWAK